jgi:dihydrofolate synthase/folylpolyglutamate synthase
LATLDVLSQRIAGITPNIIANGLRKTIWPGRYERFGNIILDGAHNPAALRVLLETLRENGVQKFTLLFAALRDKDVAEMIQLLRSHVSGGVATEVPSSRSARASALARHPRWKRNLMAIRNIDHALTEARRRAGAKPLVVTGSLYLIGEIRKRLRKGRI